MADGYREEILPQPDDRDEAVATEPPAPTRVDDRPQLDRRVVVLAAALAVAGIVLAGIGASLHYRSAPVSRADSGKTPVAAAPQRPRPRTYPTQGEVVPPVVITPQMTPKATPKASRSSARPSNSRPERRCPEGWKRYPTLVQWCKQNGYRTD